MNGLSAAALAGVTEAEVQRLADLGILAPRDGTDPFLASDVRTVRLATACERAGLPMNGIAAAIRAGPSRPHPRRGLRGRGGGTARGIARPVRLLEARRA
jgi:hypothetical protein